MPDTPDFFIPVTVQHTAKELAERAGAQRTLGMSPTEPMTDSKAEISLPLVSGYELLGELGRGGMGVVYKARHVALDRIVALKMVLAGTGARPDELTRFSNEATAAAAIQHPNVAQVYEVGRHDGLPFFSLEFCPGGSLANVLRDRVLAPREAARLVRSLAYAVQVAHDHGVLHRDLKPANVLLVGSMDRAFIPKITDFGLAKRFDPSSAETRPDGLTHAGTIIGTPSYMSPEQAAGEIAKVGPASDVYSLGAILYECLTRRPPFCGASSLDTLLAVMEEEPIAPSKLTPSVPGDLEAICLKCLEKLPAKRYASSTALAEDLDRFVTGKPTLARPLGALGRTAKWARRRPAVAGLLGLGFASLVLLTVLSAQLFRANREANRLRDRAEGTAAVALGAIDDILEQEDLPGAGDPEVQRQAMLDAVSRSLQKLGDYGGDNRDLLDRSAKASLRRGRLLVDVARLDEAIVVYAQAVESARQQLMPHPNDIAERRQLAAALNRLGGTYERKKNVGDLADAAYRESEDVRRALATETQSVSDQHDLAIVLYNRAGFDSVRGGNDASTYDFRFDLTHLPAGVLCHPIARAFMVLERLRAFSCRFMKASRMMGLRSIATSPK
jgi:tetratricopeptide (TPR) repeat protein